jgi:hypothetical protein
MRQGRRERAAIRNLARRGFGDTEVKITHEDIQLRFTTSDEGERNDLTMREQNERCLMHRKRLVICLVINFLSANLLGEVGADKLPPIDLNDRRITFRLKTARRRKFRERAKVVFGFLEARIRLRALGGNDYCGVDSVPGGFGWTLENCEQNLAFGIGVSLLHLFGALHPPEGNLVAEAVCGVAINLSVLARSRGGLGPRGWLALRLGRDADKENSGCKCPPAIINAFGNQLTTSLQMIWFARIVGDARPYSMNMQSP